MASLNGRVNEEFKIEDDFIETSMIKDKNVTVSKLSDTLNLSAKAVTLPDGCIKRGNLENQSVDETKLSYEFNLSNKSVTLPDGCIEGRNIDNIFDISNKSTVNLPPACITANNLSSNLDLSSKNLTLPDNIKVNGELTVDGYIKRSITPHVRFVPGNSWVYRAVKDPVILNLRSWAVSIDLREENGDRAPDHYQFTVINRYNTPSSEKGYIIGINNDTQVYLNGTRVNKEFTSDRDVRFKWDLNKVHTCVHYTGGGGRTYLFISRSQIYKIDNNDNNDNKTLFRKKRTKNRGSITRSLDTSSINH